MAEKQYDLVVYGATGFTGKLVCSYLEGRGGIDGLRWAMAGRSLEKLEATRDEIGASGIPLIQADAGDPASLDALAASTGLIISTVGPYQLYGEPLVAACVKAGCDYVDLCGEPLWMAEMIERHDDAAKSSGARILFSCGFDSIPAELGVWLCQQEAMRMLGKPVPRIRGRVRTFVGGPSGGSVASGMTMMKLAQSDPAKAALLADPFALTPDFTGPAHPEYAIEEDEPGVGKVGPFMLGPTDMKNVHRSNMLQGHPYGEDFVYDEKMIDPPPAMKAPPSPDSLPRPGEGPGEEIMRNGRFEIWMIGEDEGGERLRLVMKGSEEPGYRTTSKLIAETALALISDRSVPGGIWTPVAALGDALAQRVLECTAITVTTKSSES